MEGHKSGDFIHEIKGMAGSSGLNVLIDKINILAHEVNRLNRHGGQITQDLPRYVYIECVQCGEEAWHGNKENLIGRETEVKYSFDTGRPYIQFTETFHGRETINGQCRRCGGYFHLREEEKATEESS